MAQTPTSPVKPPTWRYDATRGVLNVTGDNFYRDLKYVKELIEAGQIPFMLEAIVHRVNGLDVPMILVGHHLSEWLISGGFVGWLWHFTSQTLKSA